MGVDNPWCVVFKVLLYTFDLVSDWVNGAFLLAGAQGTNHTDGTQEAPWTNHTAVTQEAPGTIHTGDGTAHYYWGSITIILPWVPALCALGPIRGSIKNKWDVVLVPVRCVLWPISVPFMM